MKKKLALLMAAIMTVAMVPMTALASTKLTVADEVITAVDKKFESRVELKRGNDDVKVQSSGVQHGLGYFEVELKLTNGKFTKTGDNYDIADNTSNGIMGIDVINDTTAIVKLQTVVFNGDATWEDPAGEAVKACVLNIEAKAIEAGDVIATFTSNQKAFTKVSDVIAVAGEGVVEIASEGVIKFVEDAESSKPIEEITIDELTATALTGEDIVLKLKGDYEFDMDPEDVVVDSLNRTAKIYACEDCSDTDKLVLHVKDVENMRLDKLTISGIVLKTTKKTDIGDVATITVTSKDFDAVKLEVAVMVEEAVTYAVEGKELPLIYAGKAYWDEDENTLKVSIEENTGDILNTSRKATFTFPEGIEVVDIKTKGVSERFGFEYEIDENVVKIWNYAKGAESDNKVDMDIEFLLHAAPTFGNEDVTVTLGGEFDDVEFTVATVKLPYTIEAKTSEVLIDYRYVPVNEIVITEAEDGILEKGDVITLEVEKMDFEDAGEVDITDGDIEVEVDVYEEGLLKVTVEDDSTEASRIEIKGLELYLDRTLPVGGYKLENINNYEEFEEYFEKEDGQNFKNNCNRYDIEIPWANNVLWENSVPADWEIDWEIEDKAIVDFNGFFKYKAVEVNDSYVEVVTQARDQDDYSTSKKIVITIGAPTMTVGTQVINLVTPAYINAENFTELPVRAISEAFGADVLWDAATKTVTVMMGQRIVSMTIGGRTMYINGTPVAMSTAPEITNDFTFVPVRDLANALGISKIDWNAAAATVTLN